MDELVRLGLTRRDGPTKPAAGSRHYKEYRIGGYSKLENTANLIRRTAWSCNSGNKKINDRT